MLSARVPKLSGAASSGCCQCLILNKPPAQLMYAAMRRSVLLPICIPSASSCCEHDLGDMLHALKHAM